MMRALAFAAAILIAGCGGPEGRREPRVVDVDFETARPHVVPGEWFVVRPKTGGTRYILRSARDQEDAVTDVRSFSQALREARLNPDLPDPKVFQGGATWTGPFQDAESADAYRRSHD